MDVEKQVLTIIARNFKKDISEISVETKLMSELGADSLDMIELMLDIEDEFKIDFEDKRAENIHSIQDAISEIKKLLSTPKVDKKNYFV
jgi:acyl carrier protein